MSDTEDSIEALHQHVVASRRRARDAGPKSPRKLPPDRHIFCNSCRRDTTHRCKADYFSPHLIGEDQYLGGILLVVGHRLWLCAGCHTGTMERYLLDDEGMPNGPGKLFPPSEREHIACADFTALPAAIRRVFEETVAAFNHGQWILCATGVRMLIEGVCADRGITGRNLQAKIDALSKALPEQVGAGLHRLRYLGNKSAHECRVPTSEDLRLGLGFCHDLLTALYELSEKSRRLTTHRNQP